MVRLVSFGFIIVAIEFIQALGLSLVVLKMGKQDSFEATRVVTSLLAKFKTDFTAFVEPLSSKLQRKTAASQEPTETLNFQALEASELLANQGPMLKSEFYQITSLTVSQSALFAPVSARDQKYQASSRY